MSSALCPKSSGERSKPAVVVVLWLGQDTTLTVPLSTQVYKWVPIAVGNLAMGFYPMLVSATYYGN